MSRFQDSQVLPGVLKMSPGDSDVGGLAPALRNPVLGEASSPSLAFPGAFQTQLRTRSSPLFPVDSRTLPSGTFQLTPASSSSL